MSIMLVLRIKSRSFDKLLIVAKSNGALIDGVLFFLPNPRGLRNDFLPGVEKRLRDDLRGSSGGAGCFMDLKNEPLVSYGWREAGAL